MKDIKTVGSVGLKTIVFYLCTTAIAITIGLLVASLAKGLPVAFIPEQLSVATMRDDMIDHRRRGDCPALHALVAQRISLQKRRAGFAPAGIVATGFRTAAHAVGRKLHMLGAINALVAQIRTARIATGAFWCFGHEYHLRGRGICPD